MIVSPISPMILSHDLRMISQAHLVHWASSKWLPPAPRPGSPVREKRRWRANGELFLLVFSDDGYTKNDQEIGSTYMNGKNERLWYESVRRSIDGSKKMTLSKFRRSIDGSCFKHLPSSSIYLSIHINSYRFIYLWLRLFPIVPPLPDQASVWPTAVEMLKSSRRFSTRWRWRALRCWEAETKIYRAVENPHHV